MSTLVNTPIKLTALLLLLALSPTTFAQYTKVSNSGKALPDSAVLGTGANDWACTYDSTAKLIWELKTSDGGLRDKDWGYTWYDSNSPDGNKGTSSGTTNCKTTGRCDTEKFTQDVNAQGLCGNKDWRMPTLAELRGLVYCSSGQGNPTDGCKGSYQSPTIDLTYFPAITMPKSTVFWSSSSDAAYSDFAWYVAFSYGLDYAPLKLNDFQVRLVRSGQSFGSLGGVTNAAPTASFTATPTSSSAALRVNLDASGSNDPDGSVATYAWSSADGQTANGKTATFTFTKAGGYDINLTVTDNQGATANLKKQVIVAPVPLLASASYNARNNTPEEALPILINDSPVQQIFLTPNDVDWYEFYAKAGKNYTIELPKERIGAAINPAVQVYDKSGNALTALITQTAQKQGISVVFNAPSTGLFRLRVSNQPPFARSNAVADNTYQLRILLTDAPLQGIIKGSVISACDLLGIRQADVSAWLAGALTASTPTHKTGEYSLELNPEQYAIKSIAEQFTPSEQPVTLIQEAQSVLDFNLTSAAGCQSVTLPVPDPLLALPDPLLLLKDQAVAVYNDLTGQLIVRDVWSGNDVYYAELQNVGDYHFQLTRAGIIGGTKHLMPGYYGFTPFIANLPNVFAFGKLWTVQLKNQGEWLFTVEKAE